MIYKKYTKRRRNIFTIQICKNLKLLLQNSKHKNQEKTGGIEIAVQMTKLFLNKIFLNYLFKFYFIVY